MSFVPHVLWTRERQLPTQGAKSVSGCSSLSEILVKLVFSLCYLFFPFQIPCSFGVASRVDFTDKHWKQQLWVDNNRFVMHVITSREKILLGGVGGTTQWSRRWICIRIIRVQISSDHLWGFSSVICEFDMLPSTLHFFFVSQG